MPDIAIKVDNLAKRYRIGLKEEINDTLSGSIASWVKSPLTNFRKLKQLSTFSDADSEDVIWALKNVSFEVGQGEVVGIIGSNGAGKSTLLKILSRITEPTEGRAMINGRVASLLEVGTGFHNELTGRENIYLNGTILGMTKKEVDAKITEIIIFSGVEKFIDTPVKRYSSGMKVRLAFSVAAHLEPKILIIDEVLAVGDTEFQRKCIGKMEEVAGSGRTVLFVSHNLAAVEALCSRTIVLKNKIVFDGPTQTGISRYLAEIVRKNLETTLRDRSDRTGSGEARFNSLQFADVANQSASQIRCGESLTIEAEVHCRKPVIRVQCAFIFFNKQGQRLFRVATESSRHGFSQLQGKLSFRCHIHKLNLLPGTYSITAHLGGDGAYVMDHVEQAATIQIIPLADTASQSNRRRDIMYMDSDWNIDIVNETAVPKDY